MSKHIVRRSVILGAAAVLGLAGSALAQNTHRLVLRDFNDFTTTTLTATPAGPVLGNPTSVTINETGYVNDGVGGNFANKHSIFFSSDGGATNRIFNRGQSFRISMNLNLAVGNNSPRKEAGFQITGNPTGTASFIVNSDAGEIVAFGGGAPFKSFGNNSLGNGYTPGTTITMGMQYLAGVGVPGTLEYFIDRDAGGPLAQETSGPLTFSNLEGGPTNFTLRAYAQVAPNLTAGNESLNVSFTNLTTTVIPEPAALAAIAASGLALLARRR